MAQVPQPQVQKRRSFLKNADSPLDLSIEGTEQTPQIKDFIYSCLNGKIDAVKSIVKEIGIKNFKIDAQNQNGNTGFMCACLNGHDIIVCYLLSNYIEYINVNIQNKSGNTGFILACGEGHYNVIQTLFQYKVNINIQNKYGYNGFILACRYGHIDIVKFLFKTNKIDINITNNDGNNGLMLACEKKHYEIIILLLLMGTNVNIKNQKDENALFIAQKNGLDADFIKLITAWVPGISNYYQELDINNKNLITDLQQKTDDYNKLLNKYKNQTQQDTITIKQKENEIQKLEENTEKINLNHEQQIKQKENEIQKLKQNTEKINLNHEQQIKQKENEIQKLKQNTEKINLNHEQQIKQKENEIQKLKQNTEKINLNHEQQIKQKENEIQKLKQKENEIQKINLNHEQQIKQKENEIQKLKQKENEIQKINLNHEQQIKQKENEIQKLKQNTEKINLNHEQQIKQKENQIQKLEENTNHHEQQIKQKENQIQKLKQNIEEEKAHHEKYQLSPLSEILKFPIFYCHWLNDEFIVLLGGGGRKGTGVSSGLMICQVDYTQSPITCQPIGYIDSLDKVADDLVMHPTKRIFSCAFQDFCHFFSYDLPHAYADLKNIKPLISHLIDFQTDHHSNPVYTRQCVSVFSPDGTLLATGGEDGIMTIWNVTNSNIKSLASTSITQCINNLDWHGSLPFISCSSYQSTCCYIFRYSDNFDLNIEHTLKHSFKKKSAVFRYSKFLNQKEDILLSILNFGRDYSVINRWDWLKGVILKQTKISSKPILKADINRDHSLICMTSSDLILYIYNTINLQNIMQFTLTHQYLPSTCVKFSPNGQHILSTSGDGSINIIPCKRKSKMVDLILLFSIVVLIISIIFATYRLWLE